MNKKFGTYKKKKGKMAYGLYNVVELILDAMIYKYINTHAYFYSDSYWNEEDF